MVTTKKVLNNVQDFFFATSSAYMLSLVTVSVTTVSLIVVSLIIVSMVALSTDIESVVLLPSWVALHEDNKAIDPAHNMIINNFFISVV